MADRRLVESWARTPAHLSRAAALLPDDLVESVEGGRLDRYREWIEHNELELALEELEGLGENNPVPRLFWGHLRDAAIEMHLDQHLSRFDQRLAEDTV